VATGKTTSLLDLIQVLSEITGNDTETLFAEPRTGDIVYSLANPARMHDFLGIKADTSLKNGLEALVQSVSI